jgi:hypothetical protein
MKFDSQEKSMLAALDPDFTISADNETAMLNDVKVKIVRVADDRLELTLELASVDFPIALSRTQTLKQLGIKADES